MRIHDLGPRADDDFPKAKKTAWSLDGAARREMLPLVRLLRPALLACCSAMLLASCVDVRAVAGTPATASRRPGANATRIERVRLGFGLSTEGRVSPGCVATSFALRDPIHLSMEVTDAPEGSTIRVAIHDVLTHRLAWSEDRLVIAGHSYLTFEIGRGLPKGRYRADSLLGDLATPPQEFVVHELGDRVR